MSKNSFQALLHNIGSCDIFYNVSNHQPAPVKWQLIVALANLAVMEMVQVLIISCGCLACQVCHEPLRHTLRILICFIMVFACSMV